MPELPEVEVLRRSLAPVLVGDRIEGLRVWERRLREPIEPRRLGALVRGRGVVALRRRAKYLWIDLERGSTLVVHLGMSGRLTVVGGDAPRELHEHVAFRLASGRRLRLRDPRRFGLVFALPTAALAGDRHFAHLGVEPLDNGFGGAALERAARGRRAPVKSFLLDGTVLSGVGNIYASEALFLAGVHPRRSVARISTASWERIAAAVVEVLEGAIGAGGTTLNDFTDGAGQAGYFQVELSVYDREGQPCARCARPVRRIVQTGRSTYYCPGCQR